MDLNDIETEGVFGDLGDFKVGVVLQGGLQNQGQIVGGRVVVFVVDAHRVGKVVTKIMTALLVLEAIEYGQLSLDTPITQPL